MPDQSGSRARGWGMGFGEVEPGPSNTVLDVPGVQVGHCAVADEHTVSGVTALVPSARNLLQAPARAGIFAGNGFGKFVGTTQIRELGRLETPLLLTGTLSTYKVADELVGWMLSRPGNESAKSVNAAVAETNDNWWAVRDHRGIVGAEHVRRALEDHRRPHEIEGCRGAGAGTVAFGFKSGIGSASRLVEVGAVAGTLGCLVQSNHSGRLPYLKRTSSTSPSRAGSVIVCLLTDLPLDARQLTRMARRGVYALARTGADFVGGSGDYSIAVSTALDAQGAPCRDDDLDPVWVAVQDVVDEAVWNSLTSAIDTSCNGRTFRALRPDDLHLPGPGL